MCQMRLVLREGPVFQVIVWSDLPSAHPFFLTRRGRTELSRSTSGTKTVVSAEASQTPPHLVYNRKPKPQSVAKCCLKSSRVGQLPQKCWGTFIWKHAWLPWSKSKAIRKMARTSTSKSSAKGTPSGNSAIQSVPVVSEKRASPNKDFRLIQFKHFSYCGFTSFNTPIRITNGPTSKISRRSQGLWSANLSEIRWNGQN